jgi:hypothetical protein
VSSEERRYTPQEATAMLPGLIDALGRIRTARQIVLSRGERIRASAPANGGGEPGSEYWEALRVLRHEIEALAGLNILLRDPEMGLLDFPTTIEGREVFLCWRLGEETVGFWHGPETGFIGRRPVDG